MYENFTDRALKVMRLANQEAKRFNNSWIDTEHILLGLIKEGSGVAADVLRNFDINLKQLSAAVEKHMIRNPVLVTGQLPLTYRVKKIIEYAGEESRKLHHKYVGDEHILLGLLRLDEGVAGFVLDSFKLTFNEIREEVLILLGVTTAEIPKNEEPPADTVNHPAHYTRGGYECLDVIEALQLDYHLGNAFKYIWRAGHKDDATEDVKKAIVYLNRWLELQGRK